MLVTTGILVQFRPWKSSYSLTDGIHLSSTPTLPLTLGVSTLAPTPVMTSISMEVHSDKAEATSSSESEESDFDSSKYDFDFNAISDQFDLRRERVLHLEVLLEGLLVRIRGYWLGSGRGAGLCSGSGASRGRAGGSG